MYGVGGCICINIAMYLLFAFALLCFALLCVIVEMHLAIKVVYRHSTSNNLARVARSMVSANQR